MVTKSVILYSSAHCPYCEQAKEFLSQNNVNYVEYRVDLNPEDARILKERTGRTATPAIALPNGEVVVGFNPVHLEELLDLENPKNI